MSTQDLPLTGVRVVEMTHMVMGPTCGMILAQLGAEIIKVEPPAGDKTRSLGGMGTSFFPLFNRGKRSVVLDFAKPEDRETMHRLLASADVFLENFRDGQLEKQGLGADELRRKYPHLIVCRPQGLFVRPLRASAGAGRGGADDVGARRHDRHGGKTAARRLFRQRHHGRHVRRDLDSRRALPEARRQGGGEGRRHPHRPVRELPVPRCPAHGRVRDDRQQAALDARARTRLADLRYLRDHRRRADLHRRRHRRPLAELLPRVRHDGISGRSRAAHDDRPDSGAIAESFRAPPRSSRDGMRPNFRRSSTGSTSASRRSTGRRICSTIRMCCAPAASSTISMPTARHSACRRCRSNGTAPISARG